MSDGHGSTPDTPSGWAPNQPPPYGDAPGSPWIAPGESPGAPPPAGPPPGQPGYPGQHGQQGPPPQQPYNQQGPPYQQHGQQQYGQQQYGGRWQPPAMRPGIIPLRPLGLGDILDGAIKLIRSNPKAVLGLSAIAAVLGAIPVAIGQAIVLGSAASPLRDSLGDPSSAGTAPEVGFFADYGGSLLSYAVQFVAVTLLSGVLTRILGRAVFGGKITVSEAWQLTRSRVPTLFGLVAISALLFLVPLGLIVALFVALSLSGADVLAVAVVGVVATVGFFVYAAFVTTRLALSASVAVLERRGVIDSLRRSWNLVTGGSWRTFGILLLTVIITGLISLVISLPFTLTATFIGVYGEGSTGPQVITAVLLAIGGTVGAMITYPFQAAVNGLLYADRRMRAEAFDLVLQTAAIEQQRQGWVHATADDLWDPSVTPGGPVQPGHPGQGSPWSPS
jgi:hypothetical protein